MDYVAENDVEIEVAVTGVGRTARGGKPGSQRSKSMLVAWLMRAPESARVRPVQFLSPFLDGHLA